MAGIFDLLNSDLGKSIISGVSGSTGTDEAKTGSLLTMALPVLMKAMERNASTPEGAEGLMGAIQGKHNGGILDNLGDLFGGGVNEEVSNDGDKILGHVLGAKKDNVTKVLGAKSGLDTGSVANILKVAAPLLMGVLGKQASQNNVTSSSGISGLLSGLLGGASSEGAVTQEQNFLEKMLDSDGDGSIIDDVAGMVLGGSSNKSGGLGSLLGGLFGK
ncbi:DUF937 domain-containing protein [Olleya sp. HaHaR_3_96]|uniref:DUF937 domain-containing protein n=1 Tax=Olleya sp. HaHaR_3_96 TaxID=2745560 RepID=UPI001C4F936B|nr:DUF937 domain-containing protein [Olleya sp. HaHaR_3_96]QXP58974.1 DUF937 domain-containing protein [Olleya sp. HaHaR_3_96]